MLRVTQPPGSKILPLFLSLSLSLFQEPIAGGFVTVKRHTQRTRRRRRRSRRGGGGGEKEEEISIKIIIVGHQRPPIPPIAITSPTGSSYKSSTYSIRNMELFLNISSGFFVFPPHFLSTFSFSKRSETIQPKLGDFQSRFEFGASKIG